MPNDNTQISKRRRGFVAGMGGLVTVSVLGNIESDASGSNAAVSAWNSTTETATTDQQTNDTPPKHEDVAWARTFGSSGGDTAKAVVQAHGGGHVFTGRRNRSLWAVHINSAGQTVWEQTYHSNTGYDIIRTPNDGYVIVGTTPERPLLMKIDTAGNVRWSHTLDTGAGAQAVSRTDDGEYVIAGSTRDDGWIAKVDATGDITWSRTVGGEKHDGFRSLTTTDTGGVVAAGITKSGDVSQAPWVVKVDSAGSQDWSRVLEAGQDDNAGWAESVIQLHDGGYALTGYRTTGNGIGLWTLDENGHIEWAKTYRRGGGSSLLQTANGGYAIGGTGTADIRLLTTDCTGQPQFTLTYAKAGIAHGYDITYAGDEGYILVGRYSDSPTYDGFVVKINVSEGSR